MTAVSFALPLGVVSGCMCRDPPPSILPSNCLQVVKIGSVCTVLATCSFRGGKGGGKFRSGKRECMPWMGSVDTRLGPISPFLDEQDPHAKFATTGN